MAINVGQVLELLERIAPIALAEPWDNVGLLAGSMAQRVDTVLCALDLTQKVLDEAVERGAQMIVTHHPILFRGRQSLCIDDPEGRLLCALVKKDIALAAMHTNFDNVHPGVNDALCEKLGLSEVECGENGMCAGSVEAMTLSQLRAHVEKALGGVVRAYGEPNTAVRRVAVLGGVGEDFVKNALQMGADAYVTGEIAYHKAMDAAAAGLCVLEAGHAATENPAISVLAGGLQKAANDVQYKVRVLCSDVEPFL